MPQELRTVLLPPFPSFPINGKLIEECGKGCIIFDNGDDGYGCHCNYLYHYLDQEEDFGKEDNLKFPLNCPLPKIVIEDDED